MSYEISKKIVDCTRNSYFVVVNNSDETREVFGKSYISLAPLISTLTNTIREGILKEKLSKLI